MARPADESRREKPRRVRSPRVHRHHFVRRPARGGVSVVCVMPIFRAAAETETAATAPFIKLVHRPPVVEELDGKIERCGSRRRKNDSLRSGTAHTA